jgi:hypothetical protein
VISAGPEGAGGAASGRASALYTSSMRGSRCGVRRVPVARGAAARDALCPPGVTEAGNGVDTRAVVCCCCESDGISAGCFNGRAVQDPRVNTKISDSRRSAT